MQAADLLTNESKVLIESKSLIAAFIFVIILTLKSVTLVKGRSHFILFFEVKCKSNMPIFYDKTTYNLLPSIHFMYLFNPVQGGRAIF